MICNFYSPQRIGLEKLKTLIKTLLPKCKIQLINQLGFDILSIEHKEHFLAAPQRLEIAYRELSNSPKCAFAANLFALRSFAQQIPAFYRRDKGRLLAKIEPICSEYSLVVKHNESIDLQIFIQYLAQETEALIFVPAPCCVAASEQPHFLGTKLELILDKKGRSATHSQKSRPALGRKRQNEQFIQQLGLAVPENLPLTEDAEQINPRPTEQISQALAELSLERIEQAAVWLWWLGLLPNLPLAASNPAEIAEKIALLSNAENLDYKTVKINQLLTQFDLYYRLQQACTDERDKALAELVAARWAGFEWLLQLDKADE